MMILGALAQQVAVAQENPLRLPETSREALVLYADREIYGAGEQIRYDAGYKAPGGLKGGSWSSVLYVELISWDGSKQASSKVLINNDQARGGINIPDNIPSGVYYLRAYTKWMRNYSASSYAYLPVKILNPYSQEILAGPQEVDRSLPDLERRPEQLSRDIRLLGLKDQYGTGEAVEIEIQVREEMRYGSYSLGIAKTRDLSSSDYLWEQRILADKGSGKIEFLPETDGLTLSGKIVDPENNEPVSQARLQLSSYADPFLYAEVLSGEDGSFLYAFPDFKGNPELHIAGDSDSLDNYNILLASEFCNKPVRLPFIPLKIDTAEQSLVKEILLNTQLKRRYEDHTAPADMAEDAYLPFYGKGATVTWVRDYIELVNLREFVYEIIPQVSVRSNSQGPYINIQGPDCLDIYPPLVLLDNIPVPNDADLLNIPGKRIERIEVLNRGYMVGNTRYSGIFSIYSSKKDMAGLSQNGGRRFFNLRMLDDTDLQAAQKEGPGLAALPRISNLLYRETGIHIPEGRTLKLNFSTPDIPGTYILTFRGSDQENRGRVLYMAQVLVK